MSHANPDSSHLPGHKDRDARTTFPPGIRQSLNT